MSFLRRRLDAGNFQVDGILADSIVTRYLRATSQQIEVLRAQTASLSLDLDVDRDLFVGEDLDVGGDLAVRGVGLFDGAAVTITGDLFVGGLLNAESVLIDGLTGENLTALATLSGQFASVSRWMSVSSLSVPHLLETNRLLVATISGSLDGTLPYGLSGAIATTRVLPLGWVSTLSLSAGPDLGPVVPSSAPEYHGDVAVDLNSGRVFVGARAAQWTQVGGPPQHVSLEDGLATYSVQLDDEIVAVADRAVVADPYLWRIFLPAVSLTSAFNYCKRYTIVDESGLASPTRPIRIEPASNGDRIVGSTDFVQLTGAFNSVRVYSSPALFDGGTQLGEWFIGCCGPRPRPRPRTRRRRRRRRTPRALKRHTFFGLDGRADESGRVPFHARTTHKHTRERTDTNGRAGLMGSTCSSPKPTCGSDTAATSVAASATLPMASKSTATDTNEKHTTPSSSSSSSSAAALAFAATASASASVRRTTTPTPTTTPTTTAVVASSRTLMSRLAPIDLRRADPLALRCRRSLTRARNALSFEFLEACPPGGRVRTRIRGGGGDAVGRSDASSAATASLTSTTGDATSMTQSYHGSATVHSFGYGLELLVHRSVPPSVLASLVEQLVPDVPSSSSTGRRDGDAEEQEEEEGAADAVDEETAARCGLTSLVAWGRVTPTSASIVSTIGTSFSKPQTPMLSRSSGGGLALDWRSAVAGRPTLTSDELRTCAMVRKALRDGTLVELTCEYGSVCRFHMTLDTGSLTVRHAELGRFSLDPDALREFVELALGFFDWLLDQVHARPRHVPMESM